jgi:hypothetical protein
MQASRHYDKNKSKAKDLNWRPSYHLQQEGRCEQAICDDRLPVML